MPFSSVYPPKIRMFVFSNDFIPSLMRGEMRGKNLPLEGLYDETTGLENNDL